MRNHETSKTIRLSGYVHADSLSEAIVEADDAVEKIIGDVDFEHVDLEVSPLMTMGGLVLHWDWEFSGTTTHGDSWPMPF